MKTAIDVSFSCVVLLLTMNFVTTYAKLMTVILDHISGFTANSWTFYDIISMVPASIDIRFVFNAKNDTKNLTARKSFNFQIFFLKSVLWKSDELLVSEMQEKMR